MKEKIIDKLIIILAIANVLMLWAGILIVAACIIFS